MHQVNAPLPCPHLSPVRHARGNSHVPADLIVFIIPRVVVRHQVDAASRKDEFTVGFVPADVRIDPQGLIPMANSSLLFWDRI